MRGGSGIAEVRAALPDVILRHVGLVMILNGRVVGLPVDGRRYALAAAGQGQFTACHRSWGDGVGNIGVCTHRTATRGDLVRISPRRGDLAARRTGDNVQLTVTVCSRCAEHVHVTAEEGGVGAGLGQLHCLGVAARHGHSHYQCLGDRGIEVLISIGYLDVDCVAFLEGVCVGPGVIGDPDGAADMHHRSHDGIGQSRMAVRGAGDVVVVFVATQTQRRMVATDAGEVGDAIAVSIGVVRVTLHDQVYGV